MPVVLAPNMSLGVNVLFKLAELAARALKAEQYDAEIFEAHHRNKVDAPSGRRLGSGGPRRRAGASNWTLVAEYARHGNTGVREVGKIGFSVVRGGDIVGDHRLIFGPRRNHRTLASRPGPLGLCPRRAGGGPLGRRASAGAVLDGDVLGL